MTEYLYLSFQKHIEPYINISYFSEKKELIYYIYYNE